MIDGSDEVLGAAETERPVTDRLDLVVHALNRCVGDADRGPGKNPIKMGAQHLGELLESLQLRAHGRVDPFQEVLLRAPGLLVSPEELEGFLEVPGARQRRIPADQGGEPLLLIRVEVPRVLHQIVSDKSFVTGFQVFPVDAEC